MNKENIIKIFCEAHEKLPILEQVIELCYDNMPKIFPDIVTSKEFCALSQELMVKILNNVVPKLQNLDEEKAQEEQKKAANNRSRYVPTYVVYNDSDDD